MTTAKTTKRDQLSPFMVREGGRYSLAKSVDKFTVAARAEIAKQDADEDLIKVCLSELFDDFKGATIGQKGLASMVVRKMGKRDPAMDHPSVFNALATRIDEIIHEDLGEGMTYGVKMGSGFFRNRDQSA
jgi:hypothetical protein